MTHSNYDSLAQQNVSEKRSVTVSLEAHQQRNLAQIESGPGVAVALRRNKAFICMKMSATVLEMEKGEPLLLFSALPEISAADTQNDLEVFW